MALLELTVRNFAIIKQLEWELDQGLTVVTGETGAGKSIVIDALNLLLGSRADSDMIRHGEEQCEITALFSVDQLSNVKQWLSSRDLEASQENTCLIRRIIRLNKPTKCYINDQPATLQSLKELGLLLVDLHGQHEHQSLLRMADQRRIIDQIADHDVDLQALAKQASSINRLKRELNKVSQNHHENSDRLELMSFQLRELEEANIEQGEFESLEQEYGRLSNAQELIDNISGASDTLLENESSNVSSQLGRVLADLEPFKGLDDSLKEAADMLHSALAQVDEAATALSASRSRIDQDPERLREVEARRDTIINLARKHRCSESELYDKYAALKSQLESLEAKQLSPERLEKEINKLTDEYQRTATMVSLKRQEVAADLSHSITEQMQELGMKGGKLNISVEPFIGDETIISEHGIDTIEFQVSSNFGSPLKSLSKTASGGELSRISLAIQVIISEKSDTPTLVFDEVDVGVGGKVAQMVGTRLKNLGQNAQVICITHQPQVASQGDQHMLVDKTADEKDTFSTLVRLNEEMRVAEIARMLGGDVITERTIAHAQEMLSGQA